MSFIDRHTITQYNPLALYMNPKDLSTMVVRLTLFNSEGDERASDTIEIVWTSEELAVIQAKLNERKAQFEANTGLTEYTP